MYTNPGKNEFKRWVQGIWGSGKSGEAVDSAHLRLYGLLLELLQEVQVLQQHKERHCLSDERQ